jgi:hypothetical protein
LTKIESRQRLGHMCELGRRFDVEVETHQGRGIQFSGRSRVCNSRRRCSGGTRISPALARPSL